MSNEVTVKQSFIVAKCHDQAVWQYDAAKQFGGDATLQFSLEKTPAWLSINEQGLISGMVPAVRHEAQFMITAVASSVSSMAELTILLDVYPNNLFTGMHDPMLNLVRVNVKPLKQDSETLQIMTYIFGYYHSHGHGEQFIAKIREQLNAEGQHLPEETSMHEIHEALQHQREETQYDMLEAATTAEVFAEAQEHVQAELSPEHVAEWQEKREHEVLEYVYAYLHAHHGQELHQLMHEHEQQHQEHEHSHAHPHHHDDYAHFKEIIEANNPQAEKQLEEMPQGMLLKKVKLTDKEMHESMLDKVFDHVQHTAAHMVFSLKQQTHFGDIEELLDHASQAVKKLISQQQLDPLFISYLHFYPHL